MHIYDIISEYFNDPIVDHVYEEIDTRLQEPWRKYHTTSHVTELLENYTGNDKVILLAIVYHDVVYFPWSDTNEFDSAELFKDHWLKYSITPEDSQTMDAVYNLILQTKDHSGTDKRSIKFNELDMAVLSRDVTGLMRWEKGIYHEFSFASTKDYKAARLAFLTKYVAAYPNLQPIIEHVQGLQPRVGYYGGSFNPFHIGHLSIVRQAQNLFDKVVVVVAQNPDKTTTDNQNERKEIIFKTIGGIEVVSLPVDEYLPNLLKERSGHEYPFLIRGIRNSIDWAAEDNQKQYMKAIWSDLNVMYLSCPKEYEHISSSGIRMMNQIEAGSGDIYIPNQIIK
jgi:pantetheine-phosphate adenylyltransferase